MVNEQVNSAIQLKFPWIRMEYNYILNKGRKKISYLRKGENPDPLPRGSLRVLYRPEVRAINRIAMKNILKSMNFVKWTRNKSNRISEGDGAGMMVTLFESDLSN
jgi:hypothetical protein